MGGGGDFRKRTSESSELYVNSEAGVLNKAGQFFIRK